MTDNIVEALLNKFPETSLREEIIKHEASFKPSNEYATYKAWLINWLEARVTKDVQYAAWVELSTIPLYLYTYYSIKRVKDTGNPGSPDPEYIFSNNAAATVMSVAVEEMLHMTLATNVLYALTGKPPVLYLNSPAAYPAKLFAHNPTGPAGPDGDKAVLIPLGKLSYQQMWHFLQVEYPEAKGAPPQDRNWDTIGQFYDAVEDMVLILAFLLGDKADALFKNGAAASQVQPYNYSPNSIDTVSPKTSFNAGKCPSQTGSAASVAVFENQPDSHVGATELLTVSCVKDAVLAITTICDQGEGSAKGTDKHDDASKSELSHYYKFLTIQTAMTKTGSGKEVLPAVPARPPIPAKTWTDTELADAGAVYNYPENPTTAEYPPEFRPLSDFCNGLFQYMLIMNETIYLVPPDQQKLFFNEGMHRSMIWVLDKYIQTMRNVTIIAGKYSGCSFAPTFENIDLGHRKDAFANLRYLGAKASIAAKEITEIAKESGSKDKISEMESLQSNVDYYVNYVTSDDDSAQRLPDVSQYWQ